MTPVTDPATFRRGMLAAIQRRRWVRALAATRAPAPGSLVTAALAVELDAVANELRHSDEMTHLSFDEPLRPKAKKRKPWRPPITAEEAEAIQREYGAQATMHPDLTRY